MLLKLQAPHYTNTYSSLENDAESAPVPPEVYVQTYGHTTSHGDFTYRQYNQTVGLHWIRKGACTFESADQAWEAQENHVYVLFPEQFVRYTETGSTPLEYEWVILGGDRVLDLLNDSGLTPAHPMIEVDPGQLSPVMADLKLRCEQDRLSLTTAATLGWRVFQAISTTRPDAASISIAQRIRFILDHHFTSPLSIEEIADQMNLSRVSLYRHFHREFGISPKQYLIQRRLERARLLLHQPGQTVSEIAFTCGFNSEAYFSRLFHQQTGRSPTRFRNQVMKGTGPSTREDFRNSEGETPTHLRKTLEK